MIIISDKLHAIKSHHTYNTRLKNSTWTGLNKAGKVQGSELDKLRNNLDNVDWADLFQQLKTTKCIYQTNNAMNGREVFLTYCV